MLEKYMKQYNEMDFANGAKEYTRNLTSINKDKGSNMDVTSSASFPQTINIIISGKEFTLSKQEVLSLHRQLSNVINTKKW